jgi:hypothetical protein
MSKEITNDSIEDKKFCTPLCQRRSQMIVQAFKHFKIQIYFYQFLNNILFSYTGATTRAYMIYYLIEAEQYCPVEK